MSKEQAAIQENQGLQLSLDHLVYDRSQAADLNWLERRLGTDTARNLATFLRTPASIIGLVVLLMFVLVAVFAPFLAPPLESANNPYTIPRDGFKAEPKPPMTEWKRSHPEALPGWYKLFGIESYTHVLGTTPGQWDIFYGIVWGTRTAFRTGVLITIAVAVIGVLIGTIAAYYGGFVDNIIMRIIDIFMTVPFIMAALVLSSVLSPIFGRSIVAPMIALITFGWMFYARLIRSNILSIKEKDYVLAARVLGVRDRKIMAKHIIPNAIYPTLVIASMDMGGYVLSFAALSFLGIGADLGYADWGQIISFSRDWITNLNTYWYTVIYPGVALFLFVLSWNLLGDAIRDVMDPKLRNLKKKKPKKA
ncbi:MAG: ABC transporter permease [Anaerolineaceae bacterium]|nr:ABC transporter permease [Anaerolineaceae bacterium]